MWFIVYDVAINYDGGVLCTVQVVAMTDPLSVSSTGAVISGLSGSAWLAFFSGVPPEVVLGAFSGSVIFVTAAQEYPIKRRLLLALVSFIAGILVSRPAAGIIIAIISKWASVGPDAVEVKSAYAGAALIMSVVAVKGLMYLYRRSGDPQAALKRGDDNDKL